MCKMKKVVESGYIKLIALDVDHLETTILMERNTNSQCDIDEFKELYGERNNVVIFIIHMDYDDDIKFSDYKKIVPSFHPFDYVRDLVSNKNGTVWHRTDISNHVLWDQSRIQYIQVK